MPRTSNIRAGLRAAVKATLAALWLAGAGCGFSPSGAGGDTEIDAPEGAIDAPPATNDAAIDGVTFAPLCDADDPDLRLCMDFEGSVASGAGTTLTVDAMNVAFLDGAVGGAARVTSASVIHVDENPALDFTTAMTIEAFVQIQPDPAPSPRVGIVDNNAQYGMWIDEDFQPYCTGNGSVVIGEAVLPRSWSHVACVFDGSTLRIYQGGLQIASAPQPMALSTNGGDGLNVGQDCRGDGQSGDPLNGSVDEVRIWSEVRTQEQLQEASSRP
jgi:hypothetical protein